MDLRKKRIEREDKIKKEKMDYVKNMKINGSAKDQVRKKERR